MSPTTVYLVRHAKAGDRGAWKGPDAQRPLTQKGRRQADGLVSLLGERGIERVVSSPFVRCVETVEPLAEHLGLAVETSDALAEGGSHAGVAELLRVLGTKALVLCSHGDVIPTVLDVLAREGLALPSHYPCAKGSTWVLEGDGDRYTSASYLPPA